jgi:hypothetical protein
MGIWYATTPASVTVHRSYQDLSIVCSLDGYDRGTLTVKSATKAMAFGNILFGGVIGAGVDIGTGAAYDYPALIKIPLTQTAKAEGEKKPADPAGPTAASEPAQPPAKTKL